MKAKSNRFLPSVVKVLFVLGIGVVFTPANAFAWGCKGHQIIALIASHNLSGQARAAALDVLANVPIDSDLKRECANESHDPLADASTWADDIRSSEPETAPWHFIDIPLGATDHDVSKYCGPKGCITAAIKKELDVISVHGMGREPGGEAVRFLIHLIGDLHQPLHAADNDDLGGNCVPINYFGAAPKLGSEASGIYYPNLHSIWDTDLLESIFPGKTAEQIAAELEQSFKTDIARWKGERVDVNAWAWESHEIAKNVVYKKLPVPIAVETPQPVSSCKDDNHIGDRMLKLQERVDAPYRDVAAPVIREQLAKAGARLAAMFNDLWQ